MNLEVEGQLLSQLVLRIQEIIKEKGDVAIVSQEAEFMNFVLVELPDGGLWLNIEEFLTQERTK